MNKKIDYDHALIIQTKYDGFRIIIEQRDNKISFFTEDKFRDRAAIFPQIVKEIKKNIKIDFIIDTEMVEWQEGKPIPRENMMWVIQTKTPMSDDVELHVNIHDVLFYDDESVNLEPYNERLALLDKLLPKDLKYLKKTKSCIATDKQSFDKCLKQAYDYPGAEGSMVKYASSIYDISKPRTPEWAKIKKVKIVNTEIIGIQKKAMPFSSIGMKTPTKDIEGDEALKLYKKLTSKSKTYIFRCAIKDDDKLVPFDSKKRLTQSDFEIKWNSKLGTPKWQGLDDPGLWITHEDFGKREAGNQAYGNTYAFGVEPAFKIGDIITVAPVQIVQFKDSEGNSRLSWMFPKVQREKPDKDQPDSLKDIEHLIREEVKKLFIYCKCGYETGDFEEMDELIGKVLDDGGEMIQSLEGLSGKCPVCNSEKDWQID